MLGNIVFSNPTTLYFGKEALDHLHTELPKYGKNVLLVYGGGSIKKSGLYDDVIKILRENGKEVFEDAGVMPNPTVQKLYEGIERARAGKVDFILAVGGGSVCDYAKAVSVSINCKEDPWEKYYLNQEAVTNEVVPVGCILTMVGTGSEMNGGSVITNHETKQKRGRVYEPDVFPKFSILNPEYTYTLPKYQMIAGFFDIMSHIMEQYFSNTDDNTSDYIAEGLMRSLIHSSRIAVANPTDYEARSNIMWTATWALNTLISMGKDQDWMVHMMGHSVGAHTDATHGMTLAAISIPYYKHILHTGLPKFKRFAEVVWGIDSNGKTDEAVALEGLGALESWMKEIGLVMNITELGCSPDMVESLANETLILPTGFAPRTREDVVAIFKASL